MRTGLQRTGLLYVGDSKLRALSLRAPIHQAGDHFLCSLGSTHLPAAALDALVTQALISGALITIHLCTNDDPSQTDVTSAPGVIAEAWETLVDLHAEAEAGPVS